jgi:hypothetical protein
MIKELKACPFCGSAARRYYPIVQHDDTEFYCCDNNDCIETVLTKELWNNRPLEDKLQAEIHHWMRVVDSLKAEISKLNGA